MKIYRLLITVLLCMGATSMPSYAVDPVGTLSVINQMVEVKQAKSVSFVPAKLNMQLFEGDQVRTGGDSSMAEIKFIDTGSKVRISAKSQITIENDSKKVTFSFGKLFLAVSKGKGGMKVKTPVAVAAVMGSVGVNEYTPSEGGSIDQYNITSLDGDFEVSDNAGNTKQFSVGNVARLTPTGIEVIPADVLNIIRVNSDVMQAAFIKVGLPPQNIVQTPQGEMLYLNTNNPNQQVEINTQTNDANLINVNHGNGQVNIPTIPVIELPPSIPYIPAINLPVILK